jgi:uncharacterized protein YjiS (DUF1127 family)
MSNSTRNAGAFRDRLAAAFRRIGTTLRTVARNYAAARELEARRYAYSRFEEHQLQDIGVDRFGVPYRDYNVGAKPVAGANDDHGTRRAA